MKRALVIATVGFLIALIVGAASRTPVSEPSFEIFFEKKCSDVEQQESQCAEIFMRDVRRKPRLAYA